MAGGRERITMPFSPAAGYAKHWPQAPIFPASPAIPSRNRFGLQNNPVGRHPTSSVPISNSERLNQRKRRTTRTAEPATTKLTTTDLLPCLTEIPAGPCGNQTETPAQRPPNIETLPPISDLRRADDRAHAPEYPVAPHPKPILMYRF